MLGLLRPSRTSECDTVDIQRGMLPSAQQLLVVGIDHRVIYLFEFHNQVALSLISRPR